MKASARIAVLLLPLIMLSCSQDIVDHPSGNQLPVTRLWLFPDSTVGVGVSKQRLHWWGEDPDGVVIGYLLAYGVYPVRVTSVPPPDTLRYTWVTGNDTLMAFPLDTLFRYYTVVVRAVDNSFAGLPYQSIVRLYPFPYLDANDNGRFDGGDVQISGLIGAMDPHGAVQTFPIRNTPPEVHFAPDPNDETVVLKQPDTTYTAATFAWNGSDPDGNNTLSSYRIALNDTSDPAAWLTVTTRDTIVTLVVPRARSDAAGPEVTADVYGGMFLGRQLLGSLPHLRLDALNVFYVQAKDVAGEYSRAIRMPGPTQHWYVRRPVARLLLVSDYVNSDSNLAASTYRTALAAVAGGEFQILDGLNIGRGLTANDKKIGKFGALVPAFVDPSLIYTFLLYDYVVWYTDQFPSLGVAQLSLFTYTQNGGKLLFSTTFESSVDPRGALRDFAPIDSISSVDLTIPPPPPRLGDTRLYAGYMVLPDSTNPDLPYPRLALNPTPSRHSVFMRPIYRRSDARYIYRLQADTTGRYIGTPNVAVVDGLKRSIFVGLPLHLLNNTDPARGNPLGVAAFFDRALNNEFSPSQKVDRKKF